MKRSEAFLVLNEMYELANEAQKQALNIAQRDIEFVDLMPDVPVQRWIPVTERLPEKWGEYLVMIEGDKRSTTLYYECADKYWFDFPNGRKFVVTHWKPLPEPPKEDAE